MMIPVYILAVIGIVCVGFFLFAIATALGEQINSGLWSYGSVLRSHISGFGWKLERARFLRKFEKQSEQIKILQEQVKLHGEFRVEADNRLFAQMDRIRKFINNCRINRGRKPSCNLNRRLEKFLNKGVWK
jgi:hypothetical protein